MDYERDCHDCQHWKPIAPERWRRVDPENVGICQRIPEVSGNDEQLKEGQAGAVCSYPWACAGELLTHATFGCKLFKRKAQ